MIDSRVLEIPEGRPFIVMVTLGGELDRYLVREATEALDTTLHALGCKSSDYRILFVRDGDIKEIEIVEPEELVKFKRSEPYIAPDPGYTADWGSDET
jgi:hypothetical protein